MAKTITISPEALEVLKRGTFTPGEPDTDQWVFKFAYADTKLARPLYEAANKALAAAGGKWTKKLGGHLFQRDPREALGVTLATGKAVNRQQTLQLFPTPAAVATRMVELLEHTSRDRVLEPSGGTGRLVDAVLEEGDPRELLVIEKDPELAADLKARYAAPTRWLMCLDFLETNADSIGTFERILMNPPFERGADLKHIRHALTLLKPGGRMVAICAAGPKQREAFCREPHGDTHPHPWVSMWETLPAKTFAPEGTNIETALVLFICPEE